MRIDDNKTLVHQWLDLWNQHALDQLATLVAPTYVHHAQSGKLLSFEQFQHGFASILQAYPDLTYAIDHLVAEDELVAVYLSAQGTHLGPLFGTPPTGKKVTMLGTYHCRIRSGKIVEDWDIFAF